MRDVQLCGWNDKRCLKHVCGRWVGLLERESRISSSQGGLTEGSKEVILDVVDVVGEMSRQDVASKTAVVGEKVEVVSQGFNLKAEGDEQ